MQLQRISAPVSGRVGYRVLAGHALEFDFDSAAALFDREGNALTISFKDGGLIILENFFEVGEAGRLPELRLPDGTVLDTEDFLLGMNPDLDVSPSAGPEANAVSSGVGDYSSDGGALLEGIDRLDDQGTFHWSAERESQTVYDVRGILGYAGPAGGANLPEEPEPPTPDPVQPDTPEPASYHTRLIVTGTGRNSFSFRAVDENGNLVLDASRIQARFADGAEYFVIKGIDPLTGQITVELTEAGLAALASGQYAKDLLIISIDGRDYNMPLVVNSDQSYDYAPEEAAADLGSELKAEWYASDASVINGGQIILGGTDYNRVDLDNNAAGKTAVNSHINVAASAKSDVNIGVDGADEVRAFAADGAAASIRGGAKSNININASTSGEHKFAYGVYTKNHLEIQGNDISIRAANTVSGGAIGVYGTGRNAISELTAGNSLEINASSEQCLRKAFSVVSGVMADSQAVINLRIDAGGKLKVTAELADTDQNTYNSANKGNFAVTGLSAKGGGQINARASEIEVSATVGEDSAHGTAAAVYSGWDAGANAPSRVNINGLDGHDNKMSFSAKAADSAIGVIGTNSGDVRIQGGDRSDTVTINAEAEKVLAIGVAAQAHSNGDGSKVYLDGGAGTEDTLNVKARFTGTHDGGQTELFESPKGAIGLAAAWMKGWGDNDAGAAQVRVDNFEKINIQADATGSNGSAIGIFTRSTSQGCPGVYIKSSGGALDLEVTAKAADASKAYSIYNYGGTVSIEGGSRAGGSGDKITLTGHVEAAHYKANNRISTGSGDDTVKLNGDLRAVSGNNTINTGAGGDRVSVSGNMKASGGSNRIDTGSGKDSVIVNGQIHASKGGKNVIDTGLNEKGTEPDSVSIKNGLVAIGNNSQNHITSDVAEIKNSAGTAIETASDIGESAETRITARHNLLVEGTGKEGEFAYGIYTQGDENTKAVLKAGTGIELNARAKGEAAGIYANWSSTAELTAESGNIKIKAESQADQAWGVSGNSNVSLRAEGAGGEITMGVKAHTNASGIWGGSYKADRLADIDVEAQQGTAAGIYSRGSSNTSVAADKVFIRARSVEGASTDEAYPFGRISGVRAMGVCSHDGSQTSIDADKIGIEAVTLAKGHAIGLLAEQWTGQKAMTGNTLDGREITVSAAAHESGHAFGLYASVNQGMGYQAANYIKAGSGGALISAQSASGKATGLFASGKGARNIIESEGNISVSATGITGSDYNPAQSTGLEAAAQGNNSLLAAGKIEIAARDGADNCAMRATDGGTNTVTASEVLVSATGGTDRSKVCGLLAEGGGANTIQAASGEGITVTIKASGADDAVALWASGHGSANRIVGDLNGGYDDKVRIEGAVKAAGNGQNAIETGAGDDTISLHGQVQKGALKVMAGDGYDLLILNAANVSEFNDFYRDWLENYGNVNGMSIEEISIKLSGPGDLGDLGDLDWLKDKFGTVSVSVSGNSNDDSIAMTVGDVSQIDFAGNGGHDSMTINFGDALDGAAKFGQFVSGSNISGLDSMILNLTQGAYELDLDGMLGKLGQATNSLFIMGDENDSLNLSGWKTGGATENHNGLDYYVYTSDDMNMTIYVQIGLTVS